MKILLQGYPYIDYKTGFEVSASTAEQKFEAMRFLRDILLKECDWAVGVDSPLPEEVKSEWLQWRQWMRDITSHVSPQDIDDCATVPDPPVVGRPRSWVNVDPAFIAKAIEAMESTQGDEKAL